LLKSGASSRTTGTVLLPAGSVTRAELLEAPRRARGGLDDLLISLTARLGAEEVAGGEESSRFGGRHESSRPRSMRSRNEEIPALTAVSPAMLPAAMRPVFTAFPERPEGRSGVASAAAVTWSPTVSRNR
jgi:hypothetical protein